MTGKGKALRMPSLRRGFTLIELMVVIVIITVLGAIAAFSTRHLSEQTQHAALKKSAQTIHQASETYFAQCGRYAPTIAELIDPTPDVCGPSGPATAAPGDGYMNAPAGWDPSLGNGPWSPYSGATMRYVPDIFDGPPTIISS